ncbi:hypothetical protein UREG_05489 [Uncinocarpus reesii 1704]|uniref:CDP-diacylglycerol--serine O-phosphatidyltransferase n=1 Tax=Uncinocarpus reesii (strain UAMH 1704) TaxID=336963 RepID=C4JSQ0_UNCRE|nr:uncharacterized protein UREG_05489 [Uncinocarpus reesii 1704]EEP80647.1 hypothetical protein UREG_05489 [Uncinocarpus reesii 1704]
MSRRSSVPIPAPAETVGSGSSANNKDPAQDKQKMLLSTDTGHFSMIRALHLADLITELNGKSVAFLILRRQVVSMCLFLRVPRLISYCVVMSIFSSMRYCLGEPDQFGALWIALAFMPFGLFFDFMDGKVARWRRKSSLMGQELDSLADLISFGVAPAAPPSRLESAPLLTTSYSPSWCSAASLASPRFNVTVATLPKDKTGKSHYFEGTPIPTTLSIAALMAYWVSKGWVLEDIPLGVVARGTAFEFHPVAGLFALWGCLMISKTLHIPKP